MKSTIITPFSFIEATKLVKEPLKYLGFRFPNTAGHEYIIPTILATANYFPGLIQMYCAKLIEALTRNDYAGYSRDATPVYNISEDHFQRILGDPDFRKKVREMIEITLEVDTDKYYYILALIFACLYYNRNATRGYAINEIIDVIKDYGITKLAKLSIENISALLEEMCELNILRKTLEEKYLFNRYNFLQVMGSSKDEVEDKLLEAVTEG